VLWVVGSVAAFFLAAVVAIGNAFTCADAGYNCGQSAAPWVILGVGFGLMALVTTVLVIGYRRKWRDDVGNSTSRQDAPH
jgi:hypothetical protein